MFVWHAGRQLGFSLCDITGAKLFSMLHAAIKIDERDSARLAGPAPTTFDVLCNES